MAKPQRSFDLDYTGFAYFLGYGRVCSSIAVGVWPKDKYTRASKCGSTGTFSTFRSCRREHNLVLVRLILDSFCDVRYMAVVKLHVHHQTLDSTCHRKL